MNRLKLPLITAVLSIGLLPAHRIMAQSQANPQITALPTPNSYQATWPGMAGRLYFIEFSTDLQTWTYAPAVNLGTGSNLAHGFSSTTGRTFLRLKYSLETDNTEADSGDFDGDGISNLTEVSTGTDPCLADTDGDGMNDDKEAALGFNAAKRDSSSPPNGIEDPWEIMDPAQASLVVSEYQASNKATIADGDGEYKDWLEILNPSTAAVSLNGWRLTDRPGGAGQVPDLAKWFFPDGITLQPGQTLLVWASGKNRRIAGQPLHTNFEFNASNEGVGIVNAAGTLVDSHRWTTNQAEDRSAGWGIDNYVGATDGRARKTRYFGVPTPGELNRERAYMGVCERPTFSVAGGLFSGSSFQVTVTAPAGTTLRYTTDFTVPTNNSPALTAPITVSGTTILRVSVTAPNCLPSPVITHSYLFKEHVLGTAPQGTLPTDHQVKPAGYPDATSEAPYTIDYAMDPGIIQEHKNALLTQLSSIPSISIVLPAPQFFSRDDDGIYANASRSAGDGDWSRQASVEYIDPAPGNGFRDHENGLLSIVGASSIFPSTTPKHSMKVEFTSRVASNNEGVMNFTQPPLPSSTVRKFRTLMLRNPTHDSWLLRWGSWLREESTYVKEAWARATHLQMGHLVAHRRWVHLHVDGLYWGVYELSERIDEDFMRAYGDPLQQYDVLSQTGPVNGNTTAYAALLNRITAAAVEPNDAARWTAVTEMLDVDNYIDYLMVNMFMLNGDWPGNNWRAARRKDLDNRQNPNAIVYASGANAQRFRFFIWDAEYSMSHASVGTDMTGATGGAAEFHGLLLSHPEYKSRWKSRVITHFNSPTGVFGIAAGGAHNSISRFTTESNTFDLAILCESARWGDGASAPGDPVPAYTRDNWVVNRDYKVNSWLAPRRTHFLSHLQARGLAD